MVLKRTFTTKLFLHQTFIEIVSSIRFVPDHDFFASRLIGPRSRV